LTGIFASKAVSGVEGSVLTQAIGAGAVMLYSGVMTALLLWLTKLIVGLRVDEQSELTGLDIAQHRERISS
jgi:Amt family ammonium transporter